MSRVETNQLQKALTALRTMRERLVQAEKATHEPIAIVGMACRMPGGANHPVQLQQLLESGTDAVIETPADRWDVNTYYDPDPAVPGKTYTKWGGFIQDVNVNAFDAGFFGISPREAVSIDPQQRMLMEVAWEALEDAGAMPDALKESRTGVYVGIMANEYLQMQIGQQDAGDLDHIDTYFGMGSEFSFAAGRISYVLGLRGPCMAINTACSSSLVSVHLACQALRLGDCDLALAGGVNLILSPEGHVIASKLRSMAPDGRCKTFDDAANGYVRGEGCGVLTLKRLSEAIRDRDLVYAVIRGSAVNHDGPSGGLTVPSGPAQQEVIRRALAVARVAPADVGYIEAHGTGTSLGDPIEMGALVATLCGDRDPKQSLIVGSCKTNFGHLEAAAGVAGLMKLVLILNSGKIPPHLHFKNPNPRIPWGDIPVEIPHKGCDWPAGYSSRIGGINSFGLSGINAHLVLEQAPEGIHD